MDTFIALPDSSGAVEGLALEVVDEGADDAASEEAKNGNDEIKVGHSIKTDFVQALKKYQHDDSLSDFTIHCQGRSWRVHRIIISAHSGYFHKLCHSSFVESHKKEIHLQEDPLFAVQVMIDFFYTLEYSGRKMASPEDRCRADRQARDHHCDSLRHAQIAILADKYDAPGLAKLACGAFRDIVMWESLIFFSLPQDPDECCLTTMEMTETIQFVFDHPLVHGGRLCQSVSVAFMLHHAFATQAFPSEATAAASRLLVDDFNALLAAVPLFARDLESHSLALTVGERALLPKFDPRTDFIADDENISRICHGDHDLWQSIVDRCVVNVKKWTESGRMTEKFGEDYWSDEDALAPGARGLKNDDDHWEAVPVDEAATADEELTDHDIGVEAESDGDPPRDLYLIEEAAEAELDDVAAEIMDIIYCSPE